MHDFEPANLGALYTEEQSVALGSKTAMRGSTATEYGMVGALVLVATVGAWAVLGNGLNQAFALVRADMIGHSLVSNVVKFGQTVVEGGEVETEEGETISTSGLNLGLDGTPTQTAGTSGDTAEAYKNLKTIRERAVQEGRMTEEEAGNLDALAKQALRLASIQKSIEKAMEQVGDNNELLPSMIIHLDGNPYTVSQLASMIGWKGNETGKGNPFIPDPAGGSELNSLKSLYLKAMMDGSLKDPMVNILVSNLTKDVANFSDVSQNAADDVEIPVPETVKDQYEESVAEQTGGQTSTSGDTEAAAGGISGTKR